MPSTSPAQKRTMAAIAHGWKPENPKIARIPVKVAKEFNQADKLRRRGVISNRAHAKMKHPELRGRISNG